MPIRPVRTSRSGPVLNRRALGRALLARQHLLTRSSIPTAAMVHHLVGMQAQVPSDPYTALWARIEDFQPRDLSPLLSDRMLVRAPLMRTTLHLVTADDALALFPHMQRVLVRTWTSTPFARDLAGVDLDALLTRGRALLDAEPLTASAIGMRLAERWADRRPGSLAQAIRYHLPLVQIPPRGTWRVSHQPTWALMERWLGRPISQELSLETLVVRYLAAFGPASVMDVQTWCWLTKLGEVVERLRSQLLTFRDEDGRELFDLPDAPRPDPETPAPPRLLPEFDNLLLSHRDRSRVIDAAARERPWWRGSMLVDGVVRGTWRLERVGDAATLRGRLHGPVRDDDLDALHGEAGRLLAFLAEEATDRMVRIEDESSTA